LSGSTEARRPHRPFVLIETPPVGFEPTTGCLEGSSFARKNPVIAVFFVITTDRLVKTG
jgi:hypothetical protein